MRFNKTLSAAGDICDSCLDPNEPGDLTVLRFRNAGVLPNSRPLNV